MKYMGSKGKVAKYILPIILKDRKPEQWYVEPFAGGMNMIDKVDGNRLANDINPFLIAMWKELLYGTWRPEYMTKEEYYAIKNNRDKYEPYLVGWAGFNLSYSGKYFGGYAGIVKTKINTIRDYQKEAINNIKKQIENLKGVTLTNVEYYDIAIPDHSIIYCDPPYEGTESYSHKFNHPKFWDWCREMKRIGHTIFVSEYNAPSDFIEIWTKEFSSSLSANGKSGGNKIRKEKLFVLPQ